MSSGGAADDSAENYSAAANVVRFDLPLPLLRAPVPSAGPGEPPALAFRDAASWRAAWDAAKASLVSLCEAGARSGCSITVSRKCRPPWWKGLFGAAPTDYEERERGEEQEMAACLEAAKEACVSLKRENALHHSEIQGSPPTVSWKIRILMSGVLAVTKHHQHIWPF